jgi:hypothetical protein
MINISMKLYPITYKTTLQEHSTSCTYMKHKKMTNSQAFNQSKPNKEINYTSSPISFIALAIFSF